MRKNNLMGRTRRLRSNNQRRVLLKKLHHKVLIRRKQFAMDETNEDFEDVC